MTAVDVVYRYGAPPGEREMQAIQSLREVYGIRRVSFQEDARTVRVEYDASRLGESVVHGLLRRAGLDIREKLVLA